MNIRVENPQTQKSQWYTFPCDEKTIQHICDEYLEVENTASTELLITDIMGDDRANSILKNQVVKLDELNLFTKCLDRLDKAENTAFYATSYALQQKELKDLINLSFNTECYNVIDDFSDFGSLGKSLYL